MQLRLSPSVTSDPAVMMKPSAEVTFASVCLWRLLSGLTWGDSNTVAIDNGSLLLLLLGGLDAGFFHVAD